MKNPTMIYKPGVKYTSDGVSYDTDVVEGDEVDAKLRDGWFKHFTEFNKAPKKRARTKKSAE